MSPPVERAPIISRRAGFAIVIAVVVARSFAQLYWSHIYFDADQAVTGLMAKHIAEGRAFPVFQYGAPYVLVLEAYLAAPLMAISDASPALLRLIPFAFNVATATLLYAVLTSRAGGLTPAIGLLATAPIALPAPTAAEELSAALGMNIEPLFFSLLIWCVRERPILLGTIAAVALRNREFVLYALAALLFTDLLRDRSMALWRPRVSGLVAFALTWSVIGVLYQHSAVYGPGTTASMVGESRDNVSVATTAMCFAPEKIPGDVWMTVSELLPLQWGVRSTAWTMAGYFGPPPADAPWLWIPLVATLAFGVVRGLWRASTRGPTWITWFGVFLVLTGLQSIVVYAATRCGNASYFTTRYFLLSVFVPSGAIVLAFHRERMSAVTMAFAGVCAAWLVVIAAAHMTVAHGHLTSPPVGSYRLLASYLEQHDIRFIQSDYWTGYHVAFLTGERVRASTGFDRINDHRLAVQANPRQVVQVWRRDPHCDGGVRVGPFFLCGVPPP
jgi:hypothetical protein